MGMPSGLVSKKFTAFKMNSIYKTGHKVPPELRSWVVLLSPPVVLVSGSMSGSRPTVALALALPRCQCEF